MTTKTIVSLFSAIFTAVLVAFLRYADKLTKYMLTFCNGGSAFLTSFVPV